jgi:hypothetical protein
MLGWLRRLLFADRVFGTNSSQKAVFADAAMPIVEGVARSSPRRWRRYIVWARDTDGRVLCCVCADVLEGYNGCLLAYGQTGSGKTFTMMGPSIDDDKEKVCVCRSHRDYRLNGVASDRSLAPRAVPQGIIPRVIEQIFEHAAKAEERCRCAHALSFAALCFAALHPVRVCGRVCWQHGVHREVLDGRDLSRANSRPSGHAP